MKKVIQMSPFEKAGIGKKHFKKEGREMKSKIIFVLVGAVIGFGTLLGFSPPALPAAKAVEMRWAVEMEIATVDPAKSTNNWEWIMALNIYDPLIFPDPDPKKKLKPWIANSWNVSPDGQTYTFHLKKGLTFHDGSEITAEDVAFSMERLVTTGGPVGTQFKMIKPGSAKVIDKYTVAFNLSSRDPAFLARMTIFRILNKSLVLKNKAPGRFGEFGDYGEKFLITHDAGSGPYKVVSMKHGDRLVLEKFEDYSLAKWGPNSIDRITVFMIPEIVTIAAKFEKGEVDLGIWSLPVKTMESWKKNPNFVVKDDVAQVSWYLVMNNKKPPLDDLYVRKAISYAFDYETMVHSILGGGQRSTGPVPAGVFGHSDDIYQYNRDLKKAKEMLQKSKYTPAHLAEFNLEIAAVAGSERFKKVALLAANNLAEIGLKGQVKAVRWTDICQAQKTPETAYPMVVFYQSATIPHPLYFLVFFTPEGWGTAYPPGGMYYQNPKVTELIEKANNTPDLEKQDDYYIEAQKLIVEDAPILFTHYDQRSTPFWRYLKGYKAPAGANFYEFWFHRFSMDVNDELYKKNHP